MSGHWRLPRTPTVRSRVAGVVVAGVLALVIRATPAAAQRVSLEARLPEGEMTLDHATLPTGVGRGADRLSRRLAWRTMRAGVQLTELDLRAGTLGIPVHAIVVRCDPRAVSFALSLSTEANGMSGSWRIDSTPTDAVLGMNAGQFKETGPWGWLLIDGDRRRDPAHAPLAASVGIDASGRIRWLPAGGEVNARDMRYGFQSFPRLLEHGRVPRVLRDGTLMDMAHRDARLILAESRDGSILFVLTRFGALGVVAERVPIGLTTPESVVLVIALGAWDAVMLDGGISGQLMVRDSTGTTAEWRGMRAVPLGLVARPTGRH